MAIKINSCTVINDSRGLENITNLKTIGGCSILGTGDISLEGYGEFKLSGVCGTIYSSQAGTGGTGKHNFFAGFCAGRSNSTGSNNTFFGCNAGCAVTTGSNNVIIGSVAGSAGLCNTVILAAGATERLKVDATGLFINGSVFTGYAGSRGDTGYTGSVGYTGSRGDTGYVGSRGDTGYTGSVGYTGSQGSCGYTGSSGEISKSAGVCGTIYSSQAGQGGTGTSNFFAGYCAGVTNSTGSNNNFFGNRAGYCNTAGSSNTFFGFCAGFRNSVGNNNTFIGGSAGICNVTGSANVFIGGLSGFTNSTGMSNIFIGYQAGYKNDTGCYNTFINYSAGACNETGTHNIFIGCNAGLKNIGSNNIFFGQSSGSNATGAGSNNIFIGQENGYSNSTGEHNIFYGRLAGYKNTSGAHNFFAGYCSGYNNTTGSNNTFFGCFSGCSVTTGSNNIIIGPMAGAAGLCNTVLMGTGTCERLRVDDTGLCINGVKYTAAISLAGTCANTTYYLPMSSASTGTWDKGAVDSTNMYYTSGNQTLYATNINFASDQRLKENIKTIQDSVNVLSRLRGVSFNWRNTGHLGYGVIAQEIEKVLPEVVHEINGSKSVNYVSLIGFLIEAIKELSNDVDTLTTKVV
jgi:hypothetical protein